MTKYIYGTDLPDGDYTISARTLNSYYKHGVQNFNEQSTKEQDTTVPTIYAKGFWNGYAAAVASIRDAIRHRSSDPTVH